LSGEAKRSYEEGKLLAADGDFVGAYAKFARAYELAKDPRLLWNMAACEKERRHYGKATRLIKAYLARGGASLSAETRLRAQATLQTLEGLVSRVTLTGLPDGARVSVDGELLATAPFSEPLLFDLGQRQLRIDAQGFDPFEQRVEVPGNQTIDLVPQLTRSSTVAQLAVTTNVAVADILVDGKKVGTGSWTGSVEAGRHQVEVTAVGKKTYRESATLPSKAQRTLHVSLDDEERVRPRWQRLAGWGALGVGAGGVVTGAILASMAMSQRSSLDCPDNICPVGTDPAAISEYDTLRTGSTIAFIAGGTLAAAGAGLLWVIPPLGKEAPIRATVGLSGLTLGGSY